jgi:hypothetical protein
MKAFYRQILRAWIRNIRKRKLRYDKDFTYTFTLYRKAKHNG